MIYIVITLVCKWYSTHAPTHALTHAPTFAPAPVHLCTQLQKPFSTDQLGWICHTFWHCYKQVNFEDQDVTFF